MLEVFDDHVFVASDKEDVEFMLTGQQAALQLAIEAFCHAQKVFWLLDDDALASGLPGELSASLAALVRETPGFNHFAATNSQNGSLEAAGFPVPLLLELRGSLLHRQCIVPCCEHVWAWRSPADERCPICSSPSTTNIIGRYDLPWVATRLYRQELAFRSWSQQSGAAAVIELGSLGFSPLFSPRLKALGRQLRAPVIRCCAAYDGPMAGGVIGLRDNGVVWLAALRDALRNTGLFPRSVPA